MILEEVFQKITEICRRNGASRVILFGSRAKGTARDRSDIDIAVCGVSDMEKLQEEIEDIPTLYTIDLVDLDTCENQLLLEDIEQYGRKISSGSFISLIFDKLARPRTVRAFALRGFPQW